MKLGSALFSISSRPKVWHLGLLKQQMEQTLEKPYVFYSDRNHYSEIFATISGERFTSVFIKANDLFQFRNSALEKGGLNGALLSVRADALEVLRERHIYSYPNQTQIEPLILRWFDYVPVLDASTLYPPVRVYGNVLDQQIYEILPWSKKEIRTEVPVPGPGVYLLGINLHGLSDYLDRTYCRLYIDGRLAENHLTDNYQYVQFHVEEPAVKTVPVRIESDSFVSSRPAAVAVALNETIDLEFGREPLKWMNFISSELKGYKFATEHGAVLCTKGEITIPSFASAERNVYARLSYRNADPEKVFPKASYRLSSLWEGEGKSIDLEPKEKSSFFVNLGKGRNGYHETSLKLSLEKAGNQINGSDETCYIIPEMRVWTLPITLDGPASYQADINNEPVFREGFYPPERSEDGYVQWSAPEAAVYLPKAAAGMSEMAVIVEAREFRPSSHRHRPSFLFNGEAIEAIVEKGPRNEVKYVLTGLNWEKNNENRLAISVKAFNPVTEIGSNDTRALGIAVSAIVVGRR